MQKKIPCHIITGMLGAGKTTAILNYLDRKQDREFTAVLVNDFGPNGIDSSVIRNATNENKLEIINIPGGCLCCSSGGQFNVAIRKLIKNPMIDRLIIEPSGVVLLDNLMSTMQELAQELPIQLAPIIMLVQPQAFNKLREKGLNYPVRLAERAHILVANFKDTENPVQLDQFLVWAQSLRPRKQCILSTSYGKIPIDLFTHFIPLSTTQSSSSTAEVTHPHFADGVTFSNGSRFNLKLLIQLMEKLSKRGIEGKNIQRLKGIFVTDSGSFLVEIANSHVYHRMIEPICESKIDWISDQPVSIKTMKKYIKTTYNDNNLKDFTVNQQGVPYEKTN